MGIKKIKQILTKIYLLPFLSIISIILCFNSVIAQEKLISIQLTYESAQECFPSWSPDNKLLVYSYISINNDDKKTGLWIMSPDGTNKRHIFFEIAEHPKWSPNGQYIIFDADSGKSIKMIHSAGGISINVVPENIQINKGGLPCWSPDGRRFAFKDEDYTIWIKDITSGRLSKIFQKAGVIALPACWTPDGKSILAALMDRATRISTIWKIPVNGSDPKQIKGNNENFYRHICISPDGSLLIYTAKVGRYLSLWVMQADGGKTIPLFESENGHNESPSWSSDEKKIAFTGSRNGNFDVYIMEVELDKIKKELGLLN